MAGWYAYQGKRPIAGRVGRIVGPLLALALLVASGCSSGSVVPDTFDTLPGTVNQGQGRAFHAAVVLPTTQDVLLLGGQDQNGLPLQDIFFAESYATFGLRFQAQTGFNTLGRVDPVAAVLVADVIVAGGRVSGVTQASLPPEFLSAISLAQADGERFDAFSLTSRIVTQTGGARGSAMVRVFANGQTDLYLLGGIATSGALTGDIRRLIGDRFVTVGVLDVPRSGHSATPLADGTVLIVGGWGAGGLPLRSSEIFDPVTGTTVTGPQPISTRARHSATANAAGDRVLIYGGFAGRDTLVAGSQVAEVYDLITDAFATVTAGNPLPRVYHGAARLNSGDIVLIGGVVDNNGTVTDSSQVFLRATDQFRTTTGGLTFPRFGHSATLLFDGTVLVAGGLSPTQTMVPKAERYIPDDL